MTTPVVCFGNWYIMNMWITFKMFNINYSVGISISLPGNVMIISDLRRIIHRTMVKLWEGLNNSYLICLNSYKMHHIEFPLPG